MNVIGCNGTRQRRSTLCIALMHINPCILFPLAVSPSASIPPPFGDVHTKPDGQTGSETNGEEEGEPLPVIPGSTDDGLDDVRANDAGNPIREAKQAEKLEAQPPVTSARLMVCEIH